MDDWIPVKNGEPVFSRANGHELWVLIIEKAWAKLHGSYHAIETGLAINALRDLTGAPCYLYKVAKTDKEKLWHMIFDGDKNNHVMSIASQPEKPEEKKRAEAEGIQTFHAYSLIDAFEI